VFNLPILRDLSGRTLPPEFQNGVLTMPGRLLRHLVILIYFVVGIFVAWEHGYLGLGWLKTVANSLLAIILWFLIPLGVNFHIH
jgi:hypothetical protein